MKKALSLSVRVKTAFLIGVLFFVIAFSGCLEASSDNASPNPTDENRATPSQQILDSSVRAISGINQNIEISGGSIVVSGMSNQIKILNADVSKIVISGNDNLIYYPKEAYPQIVNSGLRNSILTY